MKDIQQEIKVNMHGEMTDKDCKQRDLMTMISAIKIILRSIFIEPESTARPKVALGYAITEYSCSTVQTPNSIGHT